MKKKALFMTLAGIAVLVMAAFAVPGQSTGARLKRGNEGPKDTTPKIAVAYVVDVGKRPLNPETFTHLIYAFGEFNDTNDGVVIQHPERLQEIADLKKRNPKLKVMLGIGGYKKEGFSEMAGSKKKRKAFVKDVKKVIDSHGLDGVDLDWEFPTTTNGGHTASKDDDENYVLLVKDLRKALGKDKWISYYSYNTGDYIDHKGMVPYVNYVNVSGYNLNVPKDGKPGLHQSPLYPSKKFGEWSIQRSIEKHINMGIPKEKILMGIPFYGRGKSPFPTYLECRMFDQYSEGLKAEWDDEAKAPYYADATGDLVTGFDDERSITEKFDFIRANGLPGVFVWHSGGDYYDERLGKTIERLRK